MQTAGHIFLLTILTLLTKNEGSATRIIFTGIKLKGFL